MKKNLVLAVLIITVMIMSCVSKNETKETVKKETTVVNEPKVKLNLKAANAELVTKDKLMIEAENKNLGWWGSTNDQAKWTLKVPEDGEYSVSIRYSLDGEFSGSTVKLTVGDQALEFKVDGTGGWSNFTTKDFGKMMLKAGDQPVVIQAVVVYNRFVMNLTDINFTK